MVSAEALFMKPDPAGNHRAPGKGGGAGGQGHSPPFQSCCLRSL